MYILILLYYQENDNEGGIGRLGGVVNRGRGIGAGY